MLRREIKIFLVVGLCTVLIDYGVYVCLNLTAALTVDIAKGISFLAGTLFAYCANYTWTFDAKGDKYKSIVPFVALYAITLCVNVLTNALFLHFLYGFVNALQVAFLVATGGSAILNFLGMKFFVFKPHDKGELKSNFH